MLTHKGSSETEVAAEVIAGEPAAVDYQALPAAVFTDPEIGTVGLTENEAANKGMTPVTGEFQFQASGRALTANRAEGFVRIIATKEDAEKVTEDHVRAAKWRNTAKDRFRELLDGQTSQSKVKR